MQSIIKGQKIPLNNIQNFEICINWNDINCKNYDIDASVLMISNTGKMENEEDFIFYNNPKSKCSSIYLKNNLSDCKKKFIVNLNTLPINISRLIFVLTIDNGQILNQTFKNVKDISVNLKENNNNLIQYNIDYLDKETALIIFEIYKHNNIWKLQATGSGFNAGLSEIIKQYGSSKLQIEEEVSNNQQISNLQSNNNEIVLLLDFSNNMSFKLKDGSIQYLIEKLFEINKDYKFDIFISNEEAYNHNELLEFNNKNRFIVGKLLNKYFLGQNLSMPAITKIMSKYKNNKKVLYLLYKEPKDFQNSLKLIKDSVNSGFEWNIFYFEDNLDKYKSNGINFKHLKDIYSTNFNRI